MAILRRSQKLLFSVLLIFILSFLVSSYFLYPPSLGNDTWRDSIVASTVLKGGNINANFHSAYPLPVVSVLYAVISSVLGISVLSSSALIGLIYAILISFFVFILSTNINSENINKSLPAVLAVILALSIPIILLWSVGFIPEAYGIMMFLALLTVLTSKKASSIGAQSMTLIVLFIAVIVLGHGAVNLWAIGFLIVLSVLTKRQSMKNDVHHNLVIRSLIVLVTMTITYFLYTTVLDAISIGTKNVTTVLLNFLSLTTPPAKTLPTVSGFPVATAIFSYGCIAVCIVVALIAWLGHKSEHDKFNYSLFEIMFFYGLMGVLIGFLGTLYLPTAALDRYILFDSILLLVILSAKGFAILSTRGAFGKLLVAFLGVLMVSSIVFGGMITPDFNPFNVTNSFSVKTPITWSDNSCLTMISPHIPPGSLLVDWRTGLPLLFLIINQNYHSDLSFKINAGGAIASYANGTINMNYVGYSGLMSVNSSYVLNFLQKGGIFLYRADAFSDGSLLMNTTYSQFSDDLSMIGNKVFSGPIDVFVR